MDLLKVNITNEGKLVGNKQERLSLVEEDGGLDSAKLTESTKFGDSAKLAESTKLPFSKEDSGKKNQESLSSSTQAYSPPST